MWATKRARDGENILRGAPIEREIVEIFNVALTCEWSDFAFLEACSGLKMRKEIVHSQAAIFVSTDLNVCDKYPTNVG